MENIFTNFQKFTVIIQNEFSHLCRKSYDKILKNLLIQKLSHPYFRKHHSAAINAEGAVTKHLLSLKVAAVPIDPLNKNGMNSPMVP